ncbi:WhiB family transcriptional regulator [Streptomyces sp. CBMA29]|uniref:WhiB family transcriptional regulator n=1 Tax=Streptomyces sp. CBMA29 TaxID=1896314 RepID=UPI001661A44D
MRDHDPFFDSPLRAMDVCNGTRDGVVCPRRIECLRAAMHNSEPYGVWGGMTAYDRLQLRLRYPGMPERWTWHPHRQPTQQEEETPCQKAS